MRAHNWWLGLGLPAAMVWCVAVSTSMPSWFDPSEDCALTAGRASDHGVTTHSRWFPPRATCDFGGGDVYQFISPGRSATLSVIGVLVALVVVVGMVQWVKALFRTGGVIRAAEAIDLQQRKVAHLATGVVAGALGTGALFLLFVVGVIAGGAPGMVVALLISVFGLAGLASALDRAHGPLPSTAAQSRRRGTLAAVLALASSAAGMVPRSPIPQLAFVMLGAAVFMITVAVQWALPRPSILVPGDKPATAGPSAAAPR
ncbi:hypothetical protein Kfla_5667 [Kribbella flavida DSM 17836]|uniref:Uncharacterized protein n=1 Tax=Kribbella flavida (strain DSM 17836 / JCM 10339 / NBRC 14399) TaxID=479435 RepID=D2PP77_KRIFD|nr:hypothetical protein [Kribbella flavida]ADB34673.1 hypothetical protein Kfla_5667 [Kribbella flavida DSM 17836]